MSRPLQEPGAPATTTTRRPRLVGIDAARGLALIGLMCIHILPFYNPETLGATGQWSVFAGRSAALFALLAGVGLAFSTGGRTPHRGRALTADRVALLVRAALIAALGLGINELMPASTPAIGILVYYGMFFLLAIPFLGLSAPVLFAAALFFSVAGPVLVYLTRDALPAMVAENPTFTQLVTAPGATVSQLLLTGTYPALPYLTYVLAGMALGRLDLAKIKVQGSLLLGGIVLAVTAWLVYWVLIVKTGGYGQLMIYTPWLGERQIDEIIIWGPDPTVPTTTWWWLLVNGPHLDTPVSLLHSLGTGAAALGFFLLLARWAATWLKPLVAIGSMTLTLYSAHLLALTLEVHYDRPLLWFLIHLIVAVAFAMTWRRFKGQGPLERLLARIASAARRRALGPALQP